MNKVIVRLKLILICLLVSSSLFAQTQNKFSDGPYIYIEGNKVKIINIIDGQLYSESKRFDESFKYSFENSGLLINYNDLKHHPNYNAVYSGVEKICALSDVHGQYDVMLTLLKNNEIISEHNNWNFGNGHLVITGDIFDRGSNVTEILWFLYRLEKEAEQAGGKFHLLLGNHELMVLNNDLRYINKKHKNVENLTTTSYNKLYNKNSLIGNWLRSKPIVTKINDILFVHGGVSQNIVDKDYSIHFINKTFYNSILDNSKNKIKNDPTLSLLTGSYGPVWYRGYFNDSTMTDQKIDILLDHYSVNHIVVGHCSHPEILPRFNNKIIGIDSSIKLGESGQLLFYNNNTFYRKTFSGETVKLK